MRKYTICVDFDGTIVEHAFPEIGALKPGVKEALRRLSEKYVIVISSCRASALFRQPQPVLAIPDQIRADGRNYHKEMVDFLVANEIPFDRVDDGNEGKVVAIAYIDDRGINFGINNWEQIANGLSENSYWKG